MRYEQELATKERKARKEGQPAKRTPQNTQPERLSCSNTEEMSIEETKRLRFLRKIILPSYPDILLNNLCFLLVCLPVLVCVELTLLTGGLIFLAVAWLLTMLLCPGMSALYHRAYEYTRNVSPSIRVSFFSFFGRNFRQASAAGLFLGIFWILCGIYAIVGQNRMGAANAYRLLVLLLFFLLNHYSIMVMAQLSQFDLPLKAVFKNAVLLLPSCGWRGVIPAILETAYILLLFSNLWLGLLLFFLGIPNLIIILTAHLLWPRLSTILLIKT